jgi:photosystem II stability/assembly factor-like uncharacterized protein
MILFHSMCSKANWKVVHTVSTRMIWHIAYADNNTVYAVGDSLLMKSNDGGNNWIDLLPNIASATSDKVFFNLSFINKDTGFVISSTQNALPNNLYLTYDGGITWTNVTPSVLPWGMLDVQFVNQQVAYAVGGFAFSGMPDSIIARTTDGGQSWTNVPRPSLCENPMSVHFITDSIGFTGDNEIYKTTDAGANWMLTSTQSGWLNNDRITDFIFFDNLTGFSLTDNWHVYKTIDGGSTWKFYQLPVSGISSGCRDIVFDQNNFGYIVGYGLFQPFISFDAGNTWLLDGTYSPYYPSTCIAASANHKIIVGTRDGDVVLNENGPLSASTIEDLYTTNLYPNPTKGFFNITTKLKIISIEVYNLLGAKVQNISPNLNNNRYEVNLINLPKGLYVVKISDGTNSIQKKLIVE